MRSPFSSLLLLTLSLLLLAGCMAKRDYAYAPDPGYAYDDYDGDYGGYYEAEMAVAEEPSRMARKSDSSRSRAPAAPPPEPAPSAMMDSSNSAPPPRDEGQTTQPEQPKAQRMVHYDGWMRLRVTKVQDTLEAIAKQAEDVGGKVERMAGNSITVAVPVERFEASFAAIAELGDLLDKSITATDITDQFTSTELRLRTAETTRTRLQQLLAKATDEREKLQLLREIARLTEEIDLLKSKVELLATLASFSRITVEVAPRQAVGQGNQRQEPWGLGWIQRLSPFRQDVVAAGKLLKLEVPEGFVALDIKKRFVAESADGVVLRSGKLVNEPLGDTAFWMAAIQERLEPEFTEVERGTLGGYEVLTLTQGSDEPYVYVVAVSAQDDWLQVIEVYYPGLEQLERHGAAVRGVIQGTPGVSQVPATRDGRAG
jgi:hypothetical protein